MECTVLLWIQNSRIRLDTLQFDHSTPRQPFVLHHAGSKAMDEEGSNLLHKKPERIHQKSSCFMESLEDVDELARYLKDAERNESLEP